MMVKRLGVVFFTLALGLMSRQPASANHETYNYFKANEYSHDAERWGLTANYEVCYPDEWTNTIGSTNLAHMFDNLNTTFIKWVNSSQWTFNILTQMNSCGQFSAYADLKDHDYSTSWICNNEPYDHPNSSLQLENFGQADEGIVAFTIPCDTNDNGKLDWFVSVWNSDFVPKSQYDGAPDEGHPLDVLGTLVHEWAHAIGWREHFPNNLAICDNVENINTMCMNEYGNVWHGNFTVSSGMYYRTPEAHDVGEVNDHY